MQGVARTSTTRMTTPSEACAGTGHAPGSSAPHAHLALLHRKLLEAAIENENLYGILGLGDEGCDATDEQIKKACA